MGLCTFIHHLIIGVLCLLCHLSVNPYPGVLPWLHHQSMWILGGLRLAASTVMESYVCFICGIISHSILEVVRLLHHPSLDPYPWCDLFAASSISGSLHGLLLSLCYSTFIRQWILEYSIIILIQFSCFISTKYF